MVVDGDSPNNSGDSDNGNIKLCYVVMVLVMDVYCFFNGDSGL